MLCSSSSSAYAASGCLAAFSKTARLEMTIGSSGSRSSSCRYARSASHRLPCRLAKVPRTNHAPPDAASAPGDVAILDVRSSPILPLTPLCADVRCQFPTGRSRQESAERLLCPSCYGRTSTHYGHTAWRRSSVCFRQERSFLVNQIRPLRSSPSRGGASGRCLLAAEFRK